MQKPKLQNLSKKDGIDFDRAYKTLIRGYVRIYVDSKATSNQTLERKKEQETKDE